ncbi:MAG: hypothetical protein QOI24_2016 [Acidobacteriota bacterium]|nr:hypothetical protein [Acidobacteriota bacterium]
MKPLVKEEEEVYVVDDPELEAAIEEGIADLDRGESMDAFEFLRQLRNQQQ